jgi:hypothetical protein
MRRQAIVTALLTCVVAPAWGDYWVQYQPQPGAPWPEDQGWERITAYGGAQRSIEDGALVLDSLGSAGIMDYYRAYRPGEIHAEPGRPFVVEWHAQVDYATAAESFIAIFSDDQWGVGFNMMTDRIYSAYEWPLSAPFTAGSHVFRMTSWDMRSYSLAVDGVDTLSGSFSDIPWSSRISWGDGGQGGVSLSRWHWFGFGIVPEPAGLSRVCLILACGLRIVRRRRA